MANKYMADNSGNLQEVEATVTSVGAGDAGKIIGLDSTGRLDSSMMPVGVAADTKIVVASEALSAGNMVNLWNDTGTLKVRKADATTAGKQCDGFVLSAVTLGANATVYFDGQNTQMTGLTPGTLYYLDTTAGGVTTTAPIGSGNIVQKVGKALSATELTFEPGDWWVKA